MKNKNIVRMIKKTLKEGGGSFKVNNMNYNATTGYMTSIKDVAVVELKDLSISLLKQIISDNEKLLFLKNVYLRTWIENNKVFIDISKNYKNKNYCLKVAKQFNQLAIFDLNNSTSIYLK